LPGRLAAATALAMNGPQSVSIALGAALVDAVDYRVLIAGCTAVVLASGLGPLLRPVPAPAPVAAAV
jgi:hypothetical protein